MDLKLDDDTKDLLDELEQRGDREPTGPYRPPRHPNPLARPPRKPDLGDLRDGSAFHRPHTMDPVLMCEGICQAPTRHRYVGCRTAGTFTYQRFRCNQCDCERTWGAL